MAAPATTVRQTPAGKFIEDGYQTLIAFAADPNVSLWEKTVKPPGMDGGDEIDITTMHNIDYRTRASRALKTLTNTTFTAAYDPGVYDQLLALINVEGAITIYFPNDDILNFYGFLKNAEPSEHTEGEFPEMSCEIVPTNRDPIVGNEEPANYITAAGTDEPFLGIEE